MAKLLFGIIRVLDLTVDIILWGPVLVRSRNKSDLMIF